jgi:hypothetical protein
MMLVGLEMIGLEMIGIDLEKTGIEGYWSIALAVAEIVAGIVAAEGSTTVEYYRRKFPVFHHRRKMDRLDLEIVEGIRSYNRLHIDSMKVD